MKEKPEAAIALFGGGFIIAAFCLIATEMVSDALGVPRTGAIWKVAAAKAEAAKGGTGKAAAAKQSNKAE